LRRPVESAQCIPVNVAAKKGTGAKRWKHGHVADGIAKAGGNAPIPVEINRSHHMMMADDEVSAYAPIGSCGNDRLATPSTRSAYTDDLQSSSLESCHRVLEPHIPFLPGTVVGHCQSRESQTMQRVGIGRIRSHAVPIEATAADAGARQHRLEIADHHVRAMQQRTKT
jgi:hypothetical protein